MYSPSTNDVIAGLIRESRVGHQSKGIISRLAESFRPLLFRLSSTYPPIWRQDLVQEGTIALLNALRKYPASSEPDRFIHYATAAIRNRMNRFHDSVSLRQPSCTEMPSPDLDDVIIEYVLNNSPSDNKQTTDSFLHIDFKWLLSNSGFFKGYLTRREVDVIKLHIIEGCSVTEVAKYLDLSVPQSSKLIAKAKKKMQTFLN